MDAVTQLKRLKEAKELPRASYSDLMHPPSNLSQEILEEYLKDYLKPQSTCWMCEKPLVIDWGLAHGMAFCVECGMEVKVYHYIKNELGKEVKVEKALQYHPSNYEPNVDVIQEED